MVTLLDSRVFTLLLGVPSRRGHLAISGPIADIRIYAVGHERAQDILHPLSFSYGEVLYVPGETHDTLLVAEGGHNNPFL